MTAASLATGAAMGGGLLLIARYLIAPPAPALPARLTTLYEPPPLAGPNRFQTSLQALGLRVLAGAHHDPGALQRDLAVSGMTLERHALAKVTFTIAGAALPVLVAVVWSLAGITVPAGPLLVVATVAAGVGFLTPDLLLARRAAACRRDFRYSLSLFLELIVIVLAGGGGVETALNDAAKAGTGPDFTALRRVLTTAQLRRESPWEALRVYAERIGSVELAELAASVALAGTSGARVRDSLRAKAASARAHELAESEADAVAASERMGAPMVAMFVGLILLIGYPAMATVLAL